MADVTGIATQRDSLRRAKDTVDWFAGEWLRPSSALCKGEAEMQMRPGDGWQHVGGAVWEHASGTRIHMLGLVKTADGQVYSLNDWRSSEAGRRLVRINGGNRRRGLMAWAVNLTGKRTHG